MPSTSTSPADKQLSRTAAELGATFRSERIRRGWTLAELGQRAGVSRSLVHFLETGGVASLASYARLASALGLRLAFDVVDERRRERLARTRFEDPVHAAMADVQARHLRELGFGVAIDEPYQHYQFAGRADLLAWSLPDRALLHVENRTRFPNLQEAFGSFNAKRAYLAEEVARRLGVGRFRSVTHVMVVLWSAEALHSVRVRRSSFRSVCPDPGARFAEWWAGRPPSVAGTTLVIFDPAVEFRPARRRFIGLDELDGVRPRYRSYAEAAAALGRLAAFQRA